MKRPLCHFSFRRSFLAIPVGLSLLVVGCATYRETACAHLEKNRQETDYTTQYRLTETDSETAGRDFKPLGRGEIAAVRLYKMRVDPPTIKPCRHLTIHKEFYLQRKISVDLVLEEVREFYTAAGVLIATKTESIGSQLHRSGFYAGNTPLPIPEKAPPGKYRIVSKLILKTKNKSPTMVLAKTSASFQVLPRK